MLNHEEPADPMLWYDLGLPTRACNVFRREGIATVNGITEWLNSPAQRPIKYIGAKTINKIREVLQKHGLDGLKTCATCGQSSKMVGIDDNGGEVCINCWGPIVRTRSQKQDEAERLERLRVAANKRVLEVDQLAREFWEQCCLKGLFRQNYGGNVENAVEAADTATTEWRKRFAKESA